MSASNGRRRGGEFVEAIATWMRQQPAPIGVDRLLSDPLAAMLMALSVAGDRDILSRAEREQVAEVLRRLQARHAAAIATVNDICRAAMNGRKRGKLTLARVTGRRRRRRSD